MLNSKSSKRAKRFDPLRKKNILHVSTAMTWRGGEQQIAYLLHELKDEIRQTVFCLKDSSMHHYCEKNGLDVLTHPKRIRMDLTFAAQLKKACVKLEVDLCHLHDAHAHTMAVLSNVFFGNSTPLILSRRAIFPIGKSFFSRYKYNHPAIKKILCVSDKIKEVIEPFIQEKQKLVTIHSGIDIAKFYSRKGILRKELGLKEGDFLIGNTSALTEEKDYFTFISVAEKLSLNHPQMKFAVIGDGIMKAELMTFAQDKKLGNSLFFLGFRKDLPQILADLDLFLITSETEGLGTSILDAFACGVPVVGTAAGGIPELIENEKTGLLCPIKDVECLSAAVERIINAPELREKLIQEAQRKVKRFSKTETANRTLKEYQSLLN